jgi:VanZ family protein
MAMVFGLSSLSTLPTPPAGLSFYDVHVVTYAGLGALTARATGHGLDDVSWSAVLGAIVISTLYGVSDEYHQMFVPGRSFDVLDMVADAIGSVAGATAVGAWSRIRNW